MRLCREGKGTDCIKSQIQISCAEDNLYSNTQKEVAKNSEYIKMNYTATINSLRI